MQPTGRGDFELNEGRWPSTHTTRLYAENLGLTTLAAGGTALCLKSRFIPERLRVVSTCIWMATAMALACLRNMAHQNDLIYSVESDKKHFLRFLNEIICSKLTISVDLPEYLQDKGKLLHQ